MLANAAVALHASGSTAVALTRAQAAEAAFLRAGRGGEAARAARLVGTLCAALGRVEAAQEAQIRAEESGPEGAAVANGDD